MVTGLNSIVRVLIWENAGKDMVWKDRNRKWYELYGTLLALGELGCITNGIN